MDQKFPVPTKPTRLYPVLISSLLVHNRVLDPIQGNYHTQLRTSAGLLPVEGLVSAPNNFAYDASFRK
jgi:hypothetical protein